MPSAKSLKQKQSKEFRFEWNLQKTMINFKSRMNLSFGKCNGRDFLKKPEWGIRERNKGNDGKAGNQGENDGN